MTNFNATYVVNGIELEEINQAQPTSRCLPYNPDGNLFEMAAKAKDKNGQLWLVSWIFQDNGEESYENYDYSRPDNCYPI